MKFDLEKAMGFHVSFKEQEIEVVRRLQTDPASILRFESAFAGYLVFLMTGSNREELEWLRTNAISLDSLTGDAVAFFIFSMQFPIHISTNTFDLVARKKRSIKVPMEDVAGNDHYSLEQLVKSGRLGLIGDGDELVAITYAANRIAEEFGALHEMPCVIAFDPIPKTEFVIHPLGNGGCRSFEALLRRVINRLRAMPGFREHLRLLQLLAKSAKKIRLIDKQVERLMASTSSVDLETEIALTLERYAELHLALREADVIQVRRVLKHSLDLFSRHGWNDVAAFASKQVSLFQTLRSSIDALTRHGENRSWPLDQKTDRKLKMIWERYVCSLLPDLASIVPNDRQIVADAKLRLHDLEGLKAFKAIEAFPSAEFVVECITERIKENQKNYDSHLTELSAARKAWQATQYDAVIRLAQEPTLSFIDAFSRESREAATRRFSGVIAERIANYFRKWLEPESVIKLLEKASQR